MGPDERPHDRARGVGALRAVRGRDLRRVRHGSRHARHPRDAEALPARDVRGDRRLLRRPEAAHGVSRPSARRMSRARTARSSRARSRSSRSASTTRCRSTASRTSRYVAGDEILGISKLTRLVRLYARRFTVQERLGEQIADTLVELVAAARRRRAARGGAPLHADARRRRGRLAHGDDVLARPLRRRRRSAARVPRRDAVTLQLLWEQPDLPQQRAPRGAAAVLRRRRSASTARASTRTSSRRSTASSRSRRSSARTRSSPTRATTTSS